MFRFVRKSMIVVHRYLGIVLSLLFLVWFISGIGMMYARGMPSLTPQMRLERQSPLDLAAIRLSPADAIERLEMQRPPDRATLLTVMDRPAYRMGGRTIFADNGEVLEEIDSQQALAIAARFMRVPAEQLQHTLLTEVDQWTTGQGRSLPLHKITINDDAGTELYISPESASPVLLTTRGSRTLAWVAAIPHWFYFKDLRSNGPLWYSVVMWTSGLGCILAIIGIALGVIQFKFSRPFKLSRIPSYIPYTGWMRWHYITGMVFGVLTLTWVFSGMLSLEPMGWAAGPALNTGQLRETFVGGDVEWSAYPALDAQSWAELLPGRILKELEYTRIQGQPYFLARTVPADGTPPAERERIRQEYSEGGAVSDPNRLLIAANPLAIRSEPFDIDMLLQQVRESIPDARIVESQVLTEYDSYYYSRDRQAPLPILRVKFDDPVQTWVYIDPGMSQVIGGLHRLDRVERWIYNGFHSLDFAFWYYSPAWDVGVILLSLGGAATSGIGLFLGVKRIARAVKRALSPAARAAQRETAGSRT